MSTKPTPPQVDLLTAWQNYVLSVLCVALAPLFPILLEWIVKTDITEGSLLIATSMYGIAIGTASKYPIVLGVGLCVAFFETAFYGLILGSDTGSSIVGKTTFLTVSITSNQPSNLRLAPQALVIILFLLLFCLVERFKTHVDGKKDFFNLRKGKKP